MPKPLQSRALSEFCAAVVNRHAPAWPPTENQLAHEFLAYFGIARLGFYDGLVTWCGEVGVVVSMAELPHDVSGVNFWHEKNMSIVMPVNGGCLISREHTLFHELRELLEWEFEHLGQPLGDPDTLESRAEEFAATMRIALVLESSKDIFRIAGSVRDPLARFCANGLAGLVVAGAVLGCAYVRHLEAGFDRTAKTAT
jgi:hypothetical protein